MKTVAIFLNPPECSEDSCEGIRIALESQYSIRTFGVDECNAATLATADVVAFPGGIGDASSYDQFFRRKAQSAVADYVEGGGHYLGICMGAYWAGSHYFDLLDGVDAVQYIRRPDADIRRSYSTVAPITWNGQSENIYFYDGCAMVGDESRFTTVGRYANGDPCAIIQGNVGIIGPHPESQEYWYQTPWQYINQYWHSGRHHDLLLEFVNRLTQ